MLARRLDGAGDRPRRRDQRRPGVPANPARPGLGRDRQHVQRVRVGRDARLERLHRAGREDHPRGGQARPRPDSRRARRIRVRRPGTTGADALLRHHCCPRAAGRPTARAGG
ncbi:MAG: hypothetical protein M3Y09_02195 [Actinomycetota bacterium]|nr:hypothetical protein [Actinomycetota bacterium]